MMEAEWLDKEAPFYKWVEGRNGTITQSIQTIQTKEELIELLNNMIAIINNNSLLRLEIEVRNINNIDYRVDYYIKDNFDKLSKEKVNKP